MGKPRKKAGRATTNQPGHYKRRTSKPHRRGTVNPDASRSRRNRMRGGRY